MFRVHQIKTNLFKKGIQTEEDNSPLVNTLINAKEKMEEQIQLIEGRIKNEIQNDTIEKEFEKDGTDISYDKLMQMTKDYKTSASSIAVQNAALSAIDRDPEKFHKLSQRQWNITTGVKVPSNQMYSGRCWMFAGLNILVRQMINVWNVKPDFELSQSYLFFWHYVEQYNDMLTLFFREEELKDPFNDKRREFLDGPLQDGANWINFIRLAKKYGVVPKSLDGESFATVSSTEMKSALSNMISNDIYEMEDLKQQKQFDFKEFRNKKLKDVVHVLCTFMGVPPNLSENTAIIIETNVPAHKVKFVVNNPQELFSKIINTSATIELSPGIQKYIPSIEMTAHVQIINDVRKDSRGIENPLSMDNTWYTTCYQQYQPRKNLLYNIKEMDVIVNIVLTSLQMTRPVWFACNMNTDVDRFAAGMDDGLYRPDLFLPEAYESTMKKEDRMNYGLAHCNHAMLIVGAQTGKSGLIAFNVENSWGTKDNGGGFYKMTREWFVERAYTIVVHPDVIKKVIGTDYVVPAVNDTLGVYPLGDFFG